MRMAESLLFDVGSLVVGGIFVLSPMLLVVALPVVLGLLVLVLLLVLLVLAAVPVVVG